MRQDRNSKLDLTALALFACGVLVVASLITYDPADPPGRLISPPRTEITNACGSVGAWIAHGLFSSFGYTAWLAVASLFVVAVMLIAQRDVDQPILRAVGCGAALTALATLTSLALPRLSPGPEIGAGGYVGATGLALLESHFALAGTTIVALSVLAAGMLLCTDYLLLHWVSGATGVTLASGTLLRKLGVWPKVSRSRSAGAAGTLKDDEPENADEEYEYEYEEEGDEEEGDEEEYEYEYDEEDEAEDEDVAWDEEEAADEGDAAPAGSRLKVRTPGSKLDDAAASGMDDDARLSDDERGETGLIGPAALAAGAAAVAGGLKGKLKSALRIKNQDDRQIPATSSPNAAPTDAPSQTPGKLNEKSIKEAARKEIITQLDEAESRGADEFDYELPPLELLLPADDVCYEEHEREVRRKARILEKTFKNFGFNVKVVEIETGPVIAQYEVQLEAGLRLSKITGLADDVAIALRVPSVRIVAPIPGKNTVGIEVPNENRQLVRLREVIEETNGQTRRMKIPIFLGQDVAGNPMTVDLAALPHLLIAGRTGTGKSVCLNSIIVSIIMSRGPDEVRMLMIDPKMVELSGYKKLPHLMHPVVTDMRKAEAILAWAVDKMEERYALLARAGVRHVSVYNQLSEEELRDRIVPDSETEWEQIPRNLPFIVIVADEIADLMMTSGKEVEQHIIRLAQKSRAVGIHLILATQKPTVDVITGLIKSNLPARIAFQVASRTDSRVVLDEMGADKLLGNGDMLFLSPGTSMLLRGQGTYLSDDEITRVTDYVATDSPQFAKELIELKTKEDQEAAQPGGKLANRDDMYEAAVDVVVRERRGSVSLLQRCLGIGYGRAARLIDFMAEDGIVGDYNGSQAREVILSVDDWEAMSGGGGGDAAEAPGAIAHSRPALADAAKKTKTPLIAPSQSDPLPVPAAPSQKPRRTNRIVPGVDEPSDLEDDPGPDGGLRVDERLLGRPKPAETRRGRRDTTVQAATSGAASGSATLLLQENTLPELDDDRYQYATEDGVAEDEDDSGAAKFAQEQSESEYEYEYEYEEEDENEDEDEEEEYEEDEEVDEEEEEDEEVDEEEEEDEEVDEEEDEEEDEEYEEDNQTDVPDAQNLPDSASDAESSEEDAEYEYEYEYEYEEEVEEGDDCDEEDDGSAWENEESTEDAGVHNLDQPDDEQVQSDENAA